MRLSSITLLTSVLLLSTAPVLAASFQSSEEELTLSLPFSDDLYAAGGIVNVEENVEGDLIAAGGEIRVQGAVQQDLTIAGGRVSVEGPVGDDVRLAAGEILLSGTIGDDLFIAGGTVVISETAVINGDLYIGGGDVRIEGIVNGSMKLAAGRVVLKGTVKGNATAHAEDISINGVFESGATIVAGSKLSIGGDAQLKKGIVYWRPDGEMDIGKALLGGTALFDMGLSPVIDPEIAKEGAEVAFKVMLAGLFGFTFLSGAFIIFLLVILSHRFWMEGSKRIDKKSWRMFFTGLLYFFVTPIISLLFIATLLGIPVGLLLLCSYFFSLWFAKPVAALLIAAWVQTHYKYKWGRVSFFVVSVLMLLLLKMLIFVPLVGWLACFGILCLAFGALLTLTYEIFRKIA